MAEVPSRTSQKCVDEKKDINLKEFSKILFPYLPREIPKSAPRKETKEKIKKQQPKRRDSARIVAMKKTEQLLRRSTRIYLFLIIAFGMVINSLY